MTRFALWKKLAILYERSNLYTALGIPPSNGQNHFVSYVRYNLIQGILTEGEGSVQLTSLYYQVQNRCY